MVIRHMFFTAMFFLSSFLGNAWSQSAQPTNSSRFSQIYRPLIGGAYSMRGS